MKKHELNIAEIKKIMAAASILRTCPAVPFAQALKLHKLTLAIALAEQAYEDERKLLQERFDTASVDKSEDELKELINAFNPQSVALFNKQYPIAITPLPIADFEDLEISGVKEVPQQNGSVIKFSYRDAFFDLVGNLID